MRQDLAASASEIFPSFHSRSAEENSAGRGLGGLPKRTPFFLAAAMPNFFVALMLVYILVPNKKVRFMHAFWGALIALAGIYIMRKIFSTFIASSVVYATLYGAMANKKCTSDEKNSCQKNIIRTYYGITILKFNFTTEWTNG